MKDRVPMVAAAFMAALLVLAGCSSSVDSGNNGSADASAQQIQDLTKEISGGGASFPDAFYQAVNADFNAVGGAEVVTYAKSGSSDGRKQLAEKTVDFAGSDSLPKDDEAFPREILFFPTVAAPITIAYNHPGIDDLNLTADVIAGIFQADITNWSDPAIAALNPDTPLPDERITVVHRSDGSGTTKNFTAYLDDAAPDTWRLGAADSVEWPTSTQGAEKNSGVTALISQTQGAVGYADVADAAKSGLSVARVGNARGEFVLPTVAGVQAALEGAELASDLTYNPLNSPGVGAYPIAAPTWLITYKTYSDADLVESLQVYLRYVLTTGQEEAAPAAYVQIPDSFREKGLAQVEAIQVG